MEITIKELMLNLHAIQDYYNGDAQDGYVGFAREDNESVDLAIQTIRKYQKIEQIMKSKKMDALDIGLLIPNDMACILHEIKEVIEDGNDN